MPSRNGEGVNLTYLPFVTRATIEALHAYPMVNAELTGDEIVRKQYVNMGIAVVTTRALSSPSCRAVTR